MGNRYLRKMLVVGCTSVLRVAAKYKGALAEWIVAMKSNETRAARRRRLGQQNRTNLLGDNVDRRTLPRGTLHESLKLEAARRKGLTEESHQSSKFGKRYDVMIYTVAAEHEDNTLRVTSLQLVAMIGTSGIGYHQGQRSTAATKGRKYERSRTKGLKRKNAC